MNDNSQTSAQDKDLKCPECRAALKRRRSRNVNACEMVCGGCGQVFDVCDTDTVAELKNGSG